MTDERLYTMHLLQQLLAIRMNIAVVGDDIHWSDVHHEARVTTPAHGTWYATRFVAEDGEWYTACGPVLLCPRCGQESAFRVDVEDADEFAAVLELGALCACQAAPASPFPTRLLVITLCCISALVTSILMHKTSEF